MRALSDILLEVKKLGPALTGREQVLRITQDSKDIRKGDLFFAIRGTKVDGHQFVSSALEKGAVAAIVEERETFSSSPHCVWVDSTRKALGQSAALWNENPSQSFKLVGVTGTNGKTTTTFLLKEVWESLEKNVGLIGTVENQVGKKREPSQLTTPGPLELQALFARMREEKVAFAAMEVSSIALEQHRTAGTHFEAAVFTNLTQDHLDYHGTFDRYLESKLRLFTDYSVPFAVVNAEDSYANEIIRHASRSRVITFGIETDATFKVRSAHYGKSGTLAEIDTPNGVVALKIPLIGKHNLLNCLGVLATTYVLGLDQKKVVAALEFAKGAPGRLERVMAGNRFPHIFVDYAHSDDALKNVLASLNDLRRNTSGRIITVFGCGGDRDRTKRPKMAEVVSSVSDITIATSDNPRTENPETIIDEIEKGIVVEKTWYHREVNRREAIYWALKNANPEDVVLVAGKGHENYQIIGTEKFPFDDREVIREYYC